MTIGNTGSRFFIVGRVLLVALGLGILFGVTDVAVDSYFFHGQDIFEGAFHPTAFEIYERTFVLLLLIAFSAFTQISISRLKNTREALNNQLAFQQKLIDSIPLPIFYKDTAGVYLGCNQVFAGYLGMNKNQIIGQTVNEIAPKELAHIYQKADDELLRQQKPQVYEAQVVYADGERHDVIFYKNIFRAADGSLGGMIGTMIDITERKRIERALSASEKQLRGITTALGDGVYVLNENGELIYMNPAAERLLGWKGTELQGKDVHGAIHFQHVDGSRCAADDCHMLSVFKTSAPYRTESDFFTRKDGTMFPISIVATPIIEDGNVIASVSVFQDISERKEAERLNNALDDINEIIHSTLDFEEIMQLVKIEATKAIGCEAAAITLKKNDRWEMEYFYGFPEQFTGVTLSGSQAAHLNLIQKTGKPLIISDAEIDSKLSAEVVKQMSIKSILSVPLIVKKEVIGDISFVYLSRKSEFTPPQVNFAIKAGSSISLAIENARLYEGQRNIAHTLQEAILTLPAKIKGIEVGHLYRSATETTEVGGDFYDLFELAEDKIGITIGDISGKGLEAAALTSLIKNSVKAYAHVYPSLKVIMEKTNHLVVDATDESMFATLFFAVLDIRTGAMSWSRAGHSAPIFVRESGQHLLMDGSPPVGAFYETEFTEHQLHLQPGDSLVMYTDGVTEARAGQQLFGEKRLLKTVEELQALPAQELVERIYEKILDFSSGRLTDDVAILAVKL